MFDYPRVEPAKAHFSTLKRLGDDASSSRTAIATRRKSSDKWYISKAGIKDFGDKIRIDAYAYKEDLRKQLAEKLARNAAMRAALNKVARYFVTHFKSNFIESISNVF